MEIYKRKTIAIKCCKPIKISEGHIRKLLYLIKGGNLKKYNGNATISPLLIIYETL